MMNKILNGMMRVGSGLVGVGLLFSQFTFVVDGGEKAIMFDSLTGKGVRNHVLGEGMHFCIPFFYVNSLLYLYANIYSLLDFLYYNIYLLTFN